MSLFIHLFIYLFIYRPLNVPEEEEIQNRKASDFRLVSINLINLHNPLLEPPIFWEDLRLDILSTMT